MSDTEKVFKSLENLTAILDPLSKMSQDILRQNADIQTVLNKVSHRTEVLEMRLDRLEPPDKEPLPVRLYAIDAWIDSQKKRDDELFKMRFTLLGTLLAQLIGFAFMWFKK